MLSLEKLIIYPTPSLSNDDEEEAKLKILLWDFRKEMFVVQIFVP